ncbi:MAG: hypothetical protein EOR60_13805 [Mesorhizobium sp.]|jgi:hypothetical protein|nr:MAG: hypothetical protein EOR60_13805 [Mesorhizobium sp.]
MAAALERRPHLLRLGRLFNETILIEVDQDEFYLTFDKGRVVEIKEGPSKKLPWRFALRAKGDALREFWQPLPKPGFHDIFGLVKYGNGSIDGDILTLVKNLRYFKEFMALGRKEGFS